MKVYYTYNQIAGENTYYLENEQAILVVDPGSDWDKIQSKIKELDKPIAAILLTHTHYDHIMSVDLVRENFEHPPVYVAESEKTWLETPKLNLSGLDRHQDMDDVIISPAEHTFIYHQVYQLSGFDFEVRPTPGHSIGGVSFVFPKDELVLTGDALFRETIGRTDLPTGSFEQLISSISTELLTLPHHFKAYPGHGAPTTIGHEKNYNPYLK